LKKEQSGLLGPAINEIVVKKFEGLLMKSQKRQLKSLKEKLLTPENCKICGP
jgi:hypothetical protein